MSPGVKSVSHTHQCVACEATFPCALNIEDCNAKEDGDDVCTPCANARFDNLKQVVADVLGKPVSVMRKQECYISVDIEADGPIPGEYSMLSLGACEVGARQGFYAELQPISDKFDPEALEVCKLDRDALKTTGRSPLAAMHQFAEWVRLTCDGRKPIYVGFNTPFDWMFTHWYFVKYLGLDPFGISGLDLKAYYMGRFSCTSWRDTVKREIKKQLNMTIVHSHNALEDAIEQGLIAQTLFQRRV